jgi:hypothetical protein
MAFKKSIICDTYDILCDYIAVKEIKMNEDESYDILCGVWASRESKKAGKPQIQTLHFTVSYELFPLFACPKSWAYEQLRKLDYFADAEIVLEAPTEIIEETAEVIEETAIGD